MERTHTIAVEAVAATWPSSRIGQLAWHHQAGGRADPQRPARHVRQAAQRPRAGGCVARASAPVRSSCERVSQPRKHAERARNRCKTRCRGPDGKACARCRRMAAGAGEQPANHRPARRRSRDLAGALAANEIRRLYKSLIDRFPQDHDLNRHFGLQLAAGRRYLPAAGQARRCVADLPAEPGHHQGRCTPSNRRTRNGCGRSRSITSDWAISCARRATSKARSGTTKATGPGSPNCCR